MISERPKFRKLLAMPSLPVLFSKISQLNSYTYLLITYLKLNHCARKSQFYFGMNRCGILKCLPLTSTAGKPRKRRRPARHCFGVSRVAEILKWKTTRFYNRKKVSIGQFLYLVSLRFLTIDCSVYHYDLVVDSWVFHLFFVGRYVYVHVTLIWITLKYLPTLPDAEINCSDCKKE